MNHLKTNRLLSDRQYGFIGGRSTGLQMLKVLDSWTDTLDRGGQVDIIYLDFMLAWIKAFLSGRRQRVSVHRSFS